MDGKEVDGQKNQNNQTASEMARDYETLAIKSANQHYHLKRQQPFTDFPALSAHVKFCTDMHIVWREIAQKLDHGSDIYGADDDARDHYREYGL